MAKTLCPECDKLVHIKTTAEPVGLINGMDSGTARRWEIQTHLDERGNPAEPPTCLGSGRTV